MPVTDSYQRLPLASVIVKREARQRRVIKTDDLERSISQIGVLQPIIVERDGTLIAGERRLEACRALGLPDIPVRFADQLEPAELAIIELEENLKRSDLDWKDQTSAIGRIHQLFCDLDPDWTLGDTGERISMSTGQISMYLKVHADLADPRVQAATTAREAYNMLGRRDARAAGDALQELLGQPVEPEVELPLPVGVSAGGRSEGEYVNTQNWGGGQPPRNVVPLVPAGPPPEHQCLLQANFLDWAPAYAGRKFNFIHCDFPYGVQVFSGAGQFNGADAEAYSDSPDDYFTLLTCLCTNLERLLSVSGHLMFWYSEKFGDQTRQMFRRLAPSLKFVTHPLVWVKSDNAGISAHVHHSPRHVYETCLLAERGNRPMVKIASDAYSAPTDKKFHVSTKPEPMLRHFMSMLVDQHTEMLDPTAGSGAALRAAESLGARSVLGLEIDHQCVEVARGALRNARLMRAAGTLVVTPTSTPAALPTGL